MKTLNNFRNKITFSITLVISLTFIGYSNNPEVQPSIYSIDVCSNNEWFDVPIEISEPVVGCIGFDIAIQFDSHLATPTGVVMLNNSLIDAHALSYITNIVDETIYISIFLNGNGGLEIFNGKGSIATVEFKKNNTFETPLVLNTIITESYETYTQQKRIAPIHCIESNCGERNAKEFPKSYGPIVQNNLIIELEAIAYPNPVKNSLTILCNQTATIRIQDASNQIKGIFDNIPAEKPYTIDISNLQSGLYFITVSNSVQLKKLYIIKQ